eukprot:5618273-Alexandrium_andersonii.AAC.1
MGVSDFRRFRAAERAVWSIGAWSDCAPLRLDFGPRAQFGRRAEQVRIIVDTGVQVSDWLRL